MKFKTILTATLVVALCYGHGQCVDPVDAGKWIKDAFDHLRGHASVSRVEMIVHRPDWERRSRIDAWTLGQSESLIRIESPPKDKGNGTLKKGRDMWMYNPKVNRVIKLPPSMMSQSWMGSDFSNNDLAKTDSILRDYDHTLEKTQVQDGKKVYWIKSLPKPRAPVVWGMQKWAVREDNILLVQEFYDEDFVLVKSLTTHEIKMMSGRLFPSRWRMQKAESQDRYTELIYHDITFPDGLADNLFTVSSLRRR